MTKLQEGVYENLITGELQHDMAQAEQQGWVCRQEDMDDAETPTLLANHLGHLIATRLSDEALSVEERVDFANRLIDFMGGDEQEQIANKRQLLSAVLSAPQAVSLQATGREPVRPLTGFRISSLFTGGQSKVPLNAEICRDIESADSICLIVSFLKLSGLNLIYDHLKRFCEQPNHRLRIITTTYCGVTEAKAVERLAELPRTEIRISYNTAIERLHAKSYIFERNSGFSTAYIGSSNLSKSAQTDGLEWNVRVTHVENPHIIKSALAAFNIYWHSPNFEDYRVGGAEKLYAELQKARLPKGVAGRVGQQYMVLPHQKQILDQLEAVRAQGIRRNLIVAATGTGKTVISAFDYKRFAAKHDRSRLLFVAHRQEILVQALHTYQRVLADNNFGELWVGDYLPQRGISHLFVSVQTFNARYADIFASLPSDYYDYIVIDEAHHLTADSYRMLLTHFAPQLLLGLTATPERMDSRSLLPDFDNRISAEIRLPKALDEGLLTPFQYLCISDNTDLTADDLMQGCKYVATKLTERLCNQERVNLVIDRLHYYLPDETRCRALGFCATKEHARYMAAHFRRAGLRADYLTADRDNQRDTLRKQLACGEINYLFVVDMFNEGIDIPEVDTVLFLRPTDSLTVFVQQLGRGLRLSEGKELLTVFDFVAQLNRRYDFTSRFRSLMTRTDKSVAEQVTNGFTFLPHGCTIHMEEKAQRYVLDNIKAAVYNHRRLLRELQSYDHVPTLKEFVDNNGQDVRIIYKGRGNCWTNLKQEAGYCHYEPDALTKRLEKGMVNLVHANSAGYLRFVRRVLASPSPTLLSDEREQAFGTMLYYALLQDTASRVGVKSIEEGLDRVKRYPLFVQEALELADFLLDNISTTTFPVGEGIPLALEQYACYTREEVFAIFGQQTAERKMRGSVAGVFNVKDRNTELFFVTLNKSSHDFSPSTMYDDYVVSENQFHWKSQSSESHTNKGRRYVEQAMNRKKFLLFVRESRSDGFGNTNPYRCFGLVDYISSCDDRPMSIDWRMHHPILPEYVSAV